MVAIESKSRWRERIIAFAPLVLWIGVIFFLSSPEGSFNQTSRFIGPLLDFFFPTMLPETRSTIHAAVRKAAHFVEYAVLAFLAVRAFAGSTSSVLRKKRLVLALLLVAFIASLDEINQSFDLSRTGSIWDVLLDISGGLFMIAVLAIFSMRKPAHQ